MKRTSLVLLTAASVFTGLALFNLHAQTNAYPLKVYTPLPEAMPNQYPERFRPKPSLQPMVEFWRNVYAQYDLHQTILHDSRHLNVVYGVLDFQAMEENEPLRQKITEQKRGDLKAMLLRFHHGEKPITAGEQIVWNLFKDIDEHHKFLKASERIRGQRGQKSKFMEGLVRSGRYLPLIESIFEQGGVPKEISKLVFVESMFTVEAHSKAGAVGPWQFMPQTARLNKLVVNAVIDERRDPLIAAAGAVRLLRKNHELLGSWPLAINAYNTGPVRMLRAIQRLHTRRIEMIIQNFEDRGYQFASRNFYPEFLAAFEVVKNYPKYFGHLPLEEAIAFDEVYVHADVSLYDLAEATATDVAILRDLNPAYTSHLFVKGGVLPKGYTIRVPAQQQEIFLAALEEFREQRRSVPYYIVKSGDTLFDIARRHRTSVQALQALNDLVTSRIRPGQMLKIPGSTGRVVLEER